MRALLLSFTFFCAAAFGQTSLQTGSFQTKTTNAQKQSLRGHVIQAVDGGLLLYASKRARGSGYKAVEGYCVVRGVTGANGSSVQVHVVPDGTHNGYPAYKLAGDAAVLTNPSIAKLPEPKAAAAQEPVPNSETPSTSATPQPAGHQHTGAADPGISCGRQSPGGARAWLRQSS